MDTDTFWSLIDKTRDASKGDGNEQAKLLIAELSELPEQGILSFADLLRQYMDLAYTRDLWAAAYVIDCGCSDDDFSDFRAWLVCQGKTVFDAAFEDPETLVDVVQKGSETKPLYLAYVASEAYNQRTGMDMPLRLRKLPELTGEPWSEETLPTKYPRLYAKFGDCAEWHELFNNSPES